MLGLGIVAGLLLFALIVAVGGLFWGWIIMLVMGAIANTTGNLEWAWGFWQVYPIGVLVSLLVGALGRASK